MDGLKSRPWTFGPFAAAWLTLTACGIQATFVQTDADFVPRPANRRPRVFLDRLPDGPYRSVGIIEVQAPSGTELGYVVDAAAEKGQELGCDVVVDRRLHAVHPAESSLPRWMVNLGPLRRRSADPLTAPVCAPLHLPTRFMAYQSQPYYPPPTTTIVQAPPSQHEFVCGMLEALAPASDADESTLSEYKSNLGFLIWRALFADKPEKLACDGAYEALAKDTDCQQEQCRACLALAEEVLNRCDSALGERIDEVAAWQAQWQTRVGAPKPTCERALKNAIRSREAARNYPETCLASRSAGVVEQAVLQSTTR